MSFEKIEPEAEPKPEHPASRAAKMVKQLHVDNIAMIDGGHVFMKEGVDVSAEMRAACVEQIEMCDRIIARADSMDPKLWAPSAMLLEQVELTVEEAQRDDKVLASMLPEIGNYDHKG